MGKDRKEVGQKEFEAIERYLLDRMEAAERVRFEERLAIDEALRDEVTLQRRLLAIVESASFPVNGVERKQTKKLFSSRWYAAAAILLLGAVGLWYYTGPRTPSEPDLFTTYFTPDPGLITPMSAAEDYVFYDAMVDYKRKNYRKAIEKWEPLLAQQPHNDTLNYFVGVAYLADGQAEASIPLLEYAASVDESIFIDEAWFYLGMAYLKEGNVTQAKPALQRSHLEKSQAVLARLNE